VSAATESRAELAKLARLLGLDGPDSLACAHDVPAEQLRAYRAAVTDLLFEDERALLQRTAAAAKLLPAARLAKIGERALGPLICARLTGLLDPARAAEISAHLSIDFLAQLAAELDPRRVVAVLTNTPPTRVLAIALAMAARKEHVAMGRFVAYLDRATLAACVEELTDEDMLRVAFVLDDKQRLGEVVELIGQERTQRMLDGAGASGLGEQALDLADHLPRKRARRRAGN
jgi:Mg/Co/Ni transporter MgtE